MIGAGGLGFGVYIFFTFGAQITALEQEAASYCDSGRVIETQMVVTNSEAIITDANTTKSQIPDMNISITTHGESYLVMRFFTNLYLEITDQKTGTCYFSVSIDFNGESVNRAKVLYYYDEAPYPGGTSIDIYYTIPIYLEYITEPLSAGTHNIKIMWLSEGISSFTSVRLIAAASSAALNVNRTLIVQEIAHCQLFAPIGL